MILADNLTDLEDPKLHLCPCELLILDLKMESCCRLWRKRVASKNEPKSSRC